jgi:hypothetical protein
MAIGQLLFYSVLAVIAFLMLRPLFIKPRRRREVAPYRVTFPLGVLICRLADTLMDGQRTSVSVWADFVFEIFGRRLGPFLQDRN